jgi:hypothetical protein
LFDHQSDGLQGSETQGFVALAETYRKLASEMERVQPLTPFLMKNAKRISWAF